MRKKRRGGSGGSVIIPFLVTVLLSLVIIGGGMLYLLKEIQKETPDKVETPVDKVYVPSVESNMNILLIVDAANDQGRKDSFILMRSVPSESKITFVPLYSETAVKVGETISTLSNVLETDGTVKVNTKQAVENLFGIKIDKYVRMTSSTFESLYNMIGKIVYVIPPELEAEFGTGEVLLSANQASAIIGKSDYQGGETERVKHIGEIFSKIVNDANGLKLDSVYEDYYTRFLSTVETDFSSVDYKRYETAVRYMLVSDTMHSEVLTPSGNHNAENQFVMNAVFTKGITKSFTNKKPETVTSAVGNVSSPPQKAGNVTN